MLRKHLLYLTSDQLCAYQWQRGRLSDGVCFTPDRAGLDAFLDYIDGQGQAPVYLLADLIEEDFQRVLLPHVGGRAGRQLLARRLTQQYRDTPYRHVAIQGRETEGRRDDIALLSALTNPSVVQPWVTALEQLKVPLAGLYSTTLMSAALVRKLALQHEHLLLVTQQSGGLRQSYFLDGQLKFSRLTLAIDRDGVPVNLASETGKTQQFLTSIRLLGRGDVLHTAILAPDDQLARLAELCVSGADTSYQFIAMATAAARLGLEQTPALADPLLLCLLGREAPSSQYALGAAQRYFKLWRARLALYGCSALVAACAVLWVGANLWHYFGANQNAERMYSEADQYDARYRGVMSNMPPRVDKTENMKAAVLIEHLIQAQGPSPLTMVQMLSAALDKVPQIRLTQLDWKVSLPGAAAHPAAAVAQSQAMGQEGDQAAPLSSQQLGIPKRPPQTLHVEAEIQVSPDDYKSVLDSMNQFNQELARQPHLTVEIEQQPVDLRPTMKLSGKAGTAAVETNAKFTLNLTLNP